MKLIISKIYKVILPALLMVLFTMQMVNAQSVYQPYSYQFYQKFSADEYSTSTRIHTTIKPWFSDDSLLKHTYDSLMNVGKDNKGILGKRFFNEHLVDVQHPGYTVYGDILPDLQAGYNFAGDGKSTWLTTLG